MDFELLLADYMLLYLESFVSAANDSHFRVHDLPLVINQRKKFKITFQLENQRNGYL